MIFLPQTSTDLDAPAYFASKQTGIEGLALKTLGSEGDFCICTKQCVPCLDVFTDKIGDDVFKNDKYRSYFNVVKGGSTVITLIRFDSQGNEIPVIVTDNTYGILDDGALLNPRYFTYEWDFYKIWLAHGFGKYQMKLENLSLVGEIIQTIKSPVFCLGQYSDKAAHGTIRIETIQSGKIKNGNNYGTKEFTQQIRLPGALMVSKLEPENDDLQLNDDKRSLLQNKDQIFPEYILRIDLVSAPQIMLPMFDYLFANDVRVSDYNVYNFPTDPENLGATAYRSFPVKRTGVDFDPTSKVVRKTFRFTMAYAYNNVFKTNN